MSSTRLRNPLPSMLVECVLEILQSSALSQVGQARLLQGPGLGGFSNDRSVKCIHVAAAKLLSLLRREGLGAVFLVDSRRIAFAVATVIAGEARRTTRSVDHQDFRRGVTAVALGRSLNGASRTGRREFRRARLPRLAGWPIGGPPHASPTAGAATDRNACAGEQQGARTPQEPTDTESTAAEEGRRGRMRESTLPRGWGVPRRRVEPGGVIGNEHERAETDLAALCQSSAGNHDDGNRKNCNFSNKSLRHLPQGGRQLSWY